MQNQINAAKNAAGAKGSALLRKLFGYGFCTVFLLVFAGNLWSVFPLERANPMLSLLLTTLVAAAGFGAVRMLRGVRVDDPRRYEILLLVLLFLLYILAQLFVAYEFETQFTQGWDFGIVGTAARGWALYGYPGDDYFNYWPNNAPYFVFLGSYFKLCASLGIYSFSRAGILLNLVLVELSHLFVYFSARRLGGRRLAFGALALSMLNPAMLAYSAIYYTDTMSIIFPIAAFYLWLRAREGVAAGQIRAAACFGIGAAALLAVGAVMKMTVSILFAALLIDLFMSLRIKKAFAGAAALLAVFAGLYFGLQAAVAASPMLPEENPDCYIPKLHWVMMGLHGNGNYYDPDYQLTLSVPAEERDALVREQITARIKEYGVGGMLAHLWEKMSYVWGDGSYSSCFKIDRDRVRSSSLDRYMKIDGDAFAPYARYAQALMAFTILGMAACGVLVAKNGELGKALLAPCACVFGVFLFFLAWEARSRYLLNYTPLFAVMAACAWQRIYALLLERGPRRQKISPVK